MRRGAASLLLLIIAALGDAAWTVFRGPLGFWAQVTYWAIITTIAAAVAWLETGEPR